ncbi:SpaA isopeptide-forming pilin-related protein [Lactiplantibacillus paraxiangfangensis]|uniref:SpaA isopeptide-forming pilin-related protein n=1 Tax=Lactiplantibacillus paraxiangfangensis TaxID=3076224 RepID=UPI0030C7693C
MRVKLFAVLLGLLTVFATVLALGRVARASEIPTNGLTGSSAVVTDRHGTVISDTGSLSKWEDYTIKYEWSIRDGQPIANGDTATVELPNGAIAPVNLSFPIVDNNGQTVGNFVIKAGQTAGTITFNDALAHTGTNRSGTLQFYAKGTSTSDVHYDWTVNKLGWISGYDNNGLPSKLTWNVAFNPEGKELGSVVVKDTLSPNQTFVPGSVIAYTGAYNDAGNFVQNGTVTPEVSVNGSEITFTFSNITTAVNMVYNSKLSNVSSGSSNWTNTASMNGSTVSGNVSYGGSGTGNGGNDIGAGDPVGEVIFSKQDAETKAKLSGAEYELQDSVGDVIQSGLTTDANGEIAISDLVPGDYQFVETKAPTGYELDSTPIKFTINAKDTATPVQVSQSDTKTPVEPETGSVVLNKTDATDGKALAGAVYELKDAAGTVIKSGLTTDEQGQLTVDGLTPGDYQFVETKAPADYELSSKPLPFTITAGQTASVTVKATDEPEANGGEEPGTPEEPGKPEPGNPEEPGTPEEPGKPEPGNPEEPGTPEEPGKPEPGNPEEPGTPEEPGVTEPEKPGTGTPAPENPGTQTPTPGHPGVTAPGSSNQGNGSNGGNSASNQTGQPGTGTNPGTGNGSPMTTLPQTNEQPQRLYAILGLVLAGLLVALGVHFYRRRSN